MKDLKKKRFSSFSAVSILPVFIVLAICFALAGGQTAKAAPAPLSKADFTKSYGKPKLNFIKWCDNNGYDVCAWLAIYPDSGDGAGKLKDFATNRKIGIDKKYTKKAVFKKYGTAPVQKFVAKNDRIYKNAATTGEAGKKQRKQMKKCKTFVAYTFVDNEGQNDYQLRFYFDKKNRVQTIAYAKNYYWIGETFSDDDYYDEY